METLDQSWIKRLVGLAGTLSAKLTISRWLLGLALKNIRLALVFFKEEKLQKVKKLAKGFISQGIITSDPFLDQTYPIFLHLIE